MSLLINSWTEDGVQRLFLLLSLFDLFISVDQPLLNLYAAACLHMYRIIGLTDLSRGLTRSTLSVQHSAQKRAEDSGFIGCSGCSWMCLAALGSVPQPASSSG